VAAEEEEEAGTGAVEDPPGIVRGAPGTPRATYWVAVAGADKLGRGRGAPCSTVCGCCMGREAGGPIDGINIGDICVVPCVPCNRAPPI
jgi:hypothetical protein